MATRLLLPQLPLELRHEVYAYLSTGPATSYTKLKTFTTGHTTVQLLTVYRGNPSLWKLAKYGFLEALEYEDWVKRHGTEIWISVHFSGHLHTFVQEHWDKKMSASLAKLCKIYPWLSSVPSYNIRILWDPKTPGPAIRLRRGQAGGVVKAILSTLTGVQDQDVKKRKGDVSVEWIIGGPTSLLASRDDLHFGLCTFLSNTTDNTHHESRAVTAQYLTRSRTKIRLPNGHLRELELPDEKSPALLRVEGRGRVEWWRGLQGKDVAKVIKGGGKIDRVMGKGEGEPEWRLRVWGRLVMECLEGGLGEGGGG